jgi:DNA-binding MarR family transcriptional regulator
MQAIYSRKDLNMIEKDSIRSFRKVIRILERELALEIAADTACCDVTFAQCHALLELELSGQISLSDLAGRLDLDRSTLSRTVETLVRDGLVIRVTDEKDRRAVCISLSDEGIKKAGQINDLSDKYYSELFGAIPASSHRTVIDALGILAEGMRSIRGKQSCCTMKKEKSVE